MTNENTDSQPLNETELDILRNIISQQEDMPPDFQKILDDNWMKLL